MDESGMADKTSVHFASEGDSLKVADFPILDVRDVENAVLSVARLSSSLLGIDDIAQCACLRVKDCELPRRLQIFT
jgi:hypothetical protein